MSLAIKVITCHDVYNYGSSLQAYALMTYLGRLGHDVEVIDYLPIYLRSQSHFLAMSPSVSRRNVIVRLLYLLCKAPSRIVWPYVSCKREFDRFRDRYLRRTAVRFRNYQELVDNPPPADVYIAGSDQIWNTFYENGIDPAFYLSFGSKEIRRISYAASFSSSSLRPGCEGFVKEQLGKFDGISVREVHGVSLLANLGFEGVKHVLDPVFLLSPEEWEGVVESIKGLDPYILLYDFDNTDEIRGLVSRVSSEFGLKVYSVNNYKRNRYCDRDFGKVGPSVFLGLIRGASVVVSNSFHATAFSLIFGREFFVVPRRGHEVNTRMESLLRDVGLSDRLVEDPASFDFLSIPRIDVEVLRDRISDRVAGSKDFLSSFLVSEEVV